MTALLGSIASAFGWVLFGLLIAVATLLAITAIGVRIWPIKMVRLIFLLLSKLFYRVELHGLENVPQTGPVLLTPNHLSWIDGFLVMLFSPRHCCMMVYAGNFPFGWMRWVASQWRSIMISPGPKSIVRALKTANRYLKEGECVGIFPEGGISRTGQIQAFRPGVMKILEGTDAQVVPVYLDQVWGSIFSFERGKFFWKWPLQWRYPISIHFGKPVAKVTHPIDMRQAVETLGAEAVKTRFQKSTDILSNVVRVCKKRKFKSKVADSSGQDLAGGELLMRVLILRRLLRREVFGRDESHIGILLPPSAGGLITNLAVALDRRTAVNLNYTVSDHVMNECIEVAGIQHVLTSRKVMEKFDFHLNAKLIYLEDLREKLNMFDKIVSALHAYVTPASWVIRMLKLDRIRPDDVLTVIFTSGSTGTPKGVMLTYANVASNVKAIEQVVHLNSKDVVIGVLPFFHSFGFTVTLWTVGSLNIKGAYHFNPLDARQVGKLAKRHGGTILLATPTFYRSYLKRCEASDFEALEIAVAGAVKLPADLTEAFDQKFNVRPVEGYGTTELSPLVSVNIPICRVDDQFQLVQREGSVGRCVPGVSARIVDIDTGEVLDANQEGMLQISGANVMKGYMKAPEKTAEVIHDGWYVTGDMALLDDDGFIHITGRLSRFSKIGGEMVPHIRIEESLQALVGMDEEEGPSLAVTAVPDAKKGERLVVLHKTLELQPNELIAKLRESGLPNLFIPSEDSFLQVEELPVLGTGKIDLKGIKQVAIEKFTVRSV